MTDTKDLTVPERLKGGRPLGRKAMYNMIAEHGEEIVYRLLAHLRSDNPAVSMGAAKTLINKIIPDLKSNDFEGEGVKNLVGLLSVIAEKHPSVPMAE